MKTTLLISKKRQEIKEAIKCLLVFAIIVCVLLGIAEFTELPEVFFLTLMSIGYLSWTFTEYFMHRFWMHSNYRKLNNEPYHMHINHHKHPTEINITWEHRLLTIVGSLVLTGLALYWNNYLTLIVGFINGFLIYSLVHYVLHQRWGRYIFPNVQRNHIHHHGKYPDRCFSFSTIIWDWIFGTLPPKHAKISKEMEEFYFGETH